MKIAYEISNCITKNPTGIGRYITSFTSAIQQENNDVTTLYKVSRLRKREYWFSPSERPPKAYLKGISSLTNNYDIVHGLDTELPNWRKAKKLITIHDIFPIISEVKNVSSDNFIKNKIRKYEKAISISDMIVTVSNSTKNDVMQYFNVPETKIVTIYPGINQNLFKPSSEDRVREVKRKHEINKSFFFFVGAVSERKNTENLVRAFALSGLSETYDLVIAGPLAFNGEKTLKAIYELGLESNVKHINFVDDRDLVDLYSAADGFAFPTYYEGFGLPILEAMRCCTPVLTSNTGSAPEVADGNAILVSPNSIDSIADGLKQLTRVNGAQIDKAFTHASSFTWEKCAKETLNLYRALANT